MFETYNTAGYDLYQLPNHPDSWVIDPKSTESYSGTLKQVVVYMIDKFGFHVDDIEEGINILADNVENQHDCVHFGAFRSPIYSFNRKEKYDRAS